MNLATSWIDEGLTATLSDASGQTIPVDQWSLNTTPSDRTAVAVLLMLLDDDKAKADQFAVILPHRIIAGLSQEDASTLKLPSTAAYIFDIEHKGTIDQSNFMLRYRWLERGRPVVSPKRVGVRLLAGTKEYRITEPFYSLIEGIDAFNQANYESVEERLKQWGEIRKLFYEADEESISQDRYLRNTRVGVPSGFSLKFVEKDGEYNFDPMLISKQTSSNDLEDNSIEEIVSIFPENYQQQFAQSFTKFNEIQEKYALGQGWYAVLNEPLQRALRIVKEYQQKPIEQRREFAKNPISYLKKALTDDNTDEEVENLFGESEGYSERVLGFGVWEKKIIPWVKTQPNPWLPPEQLGVIIGGQRVEINPEDIPDLREQVEKAIKEGKASVKIKGIDYPATEETLEVLDLLVTEAKPRKEQEEEQEDTSEEEPAEQLKQVLQIDSNFEEASYIARRRKARSSQYDEPTQLKSQLKSHQQAGLKWLQAHWRSGSPGALLADDMGLGKTLECLAFFAWLRNEMDAGYTQKKPLLIVAPVGLLDNWAEEHEKHLSDPGLGELIRAYGPYLKQYKSNTAPKGTEMHTGLPTLNTDPFHEAGWILTTYETLRDYQHSFGKVPYAAVAFDEAQKIKTPGTLVTEAAKAVRGDFILGITGTPIENRLADLWCIVDTVQPGTLLDLKSFSQRYESSSVDEGALIGLREMLTTTNDAGLPGLMLRRTKEQNLEGLPKKEDIPLECIMPHQQAQAYTQLIESAKSGEGKGYMLKVLQAMRDVSLHPAKRADQNSEEYIGQSARLIKTFEVLDQVKQQNEKALIFLESREMQEILGILLQQRYQMENRPLVINGAVSGQNRQKRVNIFQGTVGFDVMILSPKAGGVGLTLTAANHVIHLSRWWNPAVEDQCSDRVYRIGQNKPVRIYYPMAIHPRFSEHSYDAQLHDLLERKRKLSQDMLIPPSASDEDLNNLYRNTVDQSGAKPQTVNLDDIDQMEPIQFEDFTLGQLSKAGYRAKRTPRSYDAGADGIGEWKDENKPAVIIQCKHTQSSSSCSEEAVEDLMRARSAYNYIEPVLIAITNAVKFNDKAIKLAKKENIVLVTRNQLFTWTRQL